ncbi:MAG: hypothetical protein ABS36_08665 [Acidobacteria bacterium SCN 69-37]|nr:MAG: hypothetical protein ABS36_08665 [Acidobacteria bacterium SCN 69-37]
MALVVEHDRHLLENDLSERCIAARLALYLQMEFHELDVDVEYNRLGDGVKRLSLPDDCVGRWNGVADPPAVPDVVVHSRGASGPNLLVLELKKTTNRVGSECDLIRIRAFREQLGYQYGATIECETQPNREPAVVVSAWVEDSAADESATELPAER